MQDKGTSRVVSGSIPSTAESLDRLERSIGVFERLVADLGKPGVADALRAAIAAADAG